jgi:hypothetical protein
MIGRLIRRMNDLKTEGLTVNILKVKIILNCAKNATN